MRYGKGDGFYGGMDDDDEYDNVEDIESSRGAASRALENMIQLDLATTDLNLQTLNCAINVVGNSFFWKFKSAKTKLKEIREMYNEIQKMISPQDMEVDVEVGDKNANL